MRLREIRGRPTEHFHFLLKELVTFTKLAKFSILGTRDAGFLARFNTFFSQPIIERADMDAEVSRDLRECHVWAAV